MLLLGLKTLSVYELAWLACAYKKSRANSARLLSDCLMADTGSLFVGCFGDINKLSIGGEFDLS